MLTPIEVLQYDEVKLGVSLFAGTTLFLAFLIHLMANNDGFVTEHYKVSVETEYYVLDSHFMITEIYNRDKKQDL